MRIWWCMNYDVWSDLPVGGCLYSTRTLVEGMMARGHDVMTMNPQMKDDWRPDWMRLVVENNRFAKWFGKWLEADPPDVVIAQNHVYPYIVRECVRVGVPVAIVVRDIRYRCPNFAIKGGCDNPPASGRCSYCVGKMALLPYPWFRHHINLMREMTLKADAQIVPSKYIADDMRTWILGSKPVVIPPPVDDSHVPDSWRPRDVLYMGKGTYKGADLVIEMARALQHRTDFRFRICGRQEPSHAMQFQALPNVDYLGFVDRRVAYERAALHVAPARWEEPASRSVCEAQYVGIPSLCNRAGGQVESMGMGGIVIKDVEDVAAWTEAIEAIMDDAGWWLMLSTLARKEAVRKRADACSKTLEGVLEGIA